MQSWLASKKAIESHTISEEEFADQFVGSYLSTLARGWWYYGGAFLCFILATALAFQDAPGPLIRIIFGAFALIIFAFATYFYLMADEFIEFLSRHARAQLLSAILTERLCNILLGLLGGGICFEMFRMQVFREK